jgi:exodeoxyribonuclease V alpha subunit
VLLGDKDQLASVEAGAVLGDLCRDAEDGCYWPQTQPGWSRSVAIAGQQRPATGRKPRNPLAQQMVMLRHSRRFGEGSGIGQLARLVNRQQAAEARAAGQQAR